MKEIITCYFIDVSFGCWHHFGLYLLACCEHNYLDRTVLPWHKNRREQRKVTDQPKRGLDSWKTCFLPYMILSKMYQKVKSVDNKKCSFISINSLFLTRVTTGWEDFCLCSIVEITGVEQESSLQIVLSATDPRSVILRDGISPAATVKNSASWKALVRLYFTKIFMFQISLLAFYMWCTRKEISL